MKLPVFHTDQPSTPDPPFWLEEHVLEMILLSREPRRQPQAHSEARMSEGEWH